MAFLVGIMGPLASSSQMKQLVYSHANAKVAGDLSSIVENDVIAYMGYLPDEVKEDVIMLLPNRGALLGKVFDREHYQQIRDMEKVAKELQDPKVIFSNYWGRYVGVLCNRNTQEKALIRDPLGLSTLFYTSIDGSIIFSTDMALLHDILPKKPTTHWNYFANFITNYDPVSSATPFEEIQELLPGALLTFDDQGKIVIKYPWNIEAFSSTYIHDGAAFEEELLEMLKKCIGAWVENSNGVCVEFSGGLDSSALVILLNELMPADKKIIGINYFDSKIRGSNEIEHAQAVADIYAMPLHFLDWDEASMLDALPASWRPPKPGPHMFVYDQGKQIADIAVQNDCDIIMNGQGGDHVFMAPAPDDALADAWIDGRFSEIPRVLNELCSTYRAPWMTVIRRNMYALKNYYFPSHIIERPSSFERPEICLTQQFVEYCNAHRFYLDDRIAAFPPARARQFRSIINHISTIERDRRFSLRSFTHPLFSQPLVELALKIPSYQSFKGGYDRIFFRKAVSRLKRSNSLWRTVKGNTTGTAMKTLAQNSEKLKKLLLQGSLVENRVVNKDWVEKELIALQHSKTKISPNFVNMIMCQLWLNQWGR